jgi:hypothetical protein
MQSSKAYNEGAMGVYATMAAFQDSWHEGNHVRYPLPHNEHVRATTPKQNKKQNMAKAKHHSIQVDLRVRPCP